MKAEQVLPKLCKYYSCLSRADYEFTDVMDGKTVSLGYSCRRHVSNVRKLLEKIYAKEEIY